MIEPSRYDDEPIDDETIEGDAAGAAAVSDEERAAIDAGGDPVLRSAPRRLDVEGPNPA